MAKPIQEKLKNSIIATKGLYHQLVLLVGRNGSGKTAILRDVANDFGTTIINVNLVLSSQLLELTARQRALRLPGLFDQITENVQSPVVLDNLEILFDKELKQDPLRLLQGISRNRSVIASWNGIFSGKRLLYAKMGHPEYRSYDSLDALIISMDGTSSIHSGNEIEAGQA